MYVRISITSSRAKLHSQDFHISLISDGKGEKQKMNCKQLAIQPAGLQRYASQPTNRSINVLRHAYVLYVRTLWKEKRIKHRTKTYTFCT